MIANQTVSVTRTNYDLKQPQTSTTSPTIKPPQPTSSPQATPLPTTAPSHTLNGGALPVTTNTVEHFVNNWLATFARFDAWVLGRTTWLAAIRE